MLQNRIGEEMNEWSALKCFISNCPVLYHTARSSSDRCLWKQGGRGAGVFPLGMYLLGSIFVKANITSYIAEGATVLGSSQQKAFPLMQLDGAQFLLRMQGMLQSQVLTTALSCHLCRP